MRREAASAGFYESPWGKHPRIQLLTIEDLLGGKKHRLPPGYRRDFQKGTAGEIQSIGEAEKPTDDGRAPRKRLAMSELKLS